MLSWILKISIHKVCVWNSRILKSQPHLPEDSEKIGYKTRCRHLDAMSIVQPVVTVKNQKNNNKKTNKQTKTKQKQTNNLWNNLKKYHVLIQNKSQKKELRIISDRSDH